MTDTVPPAIRKKIMSSVRTKNTRPEVALRKALHALGLRYWLNRRDLPGSPDLVFPRWGVALFVNGCFWHRHEGCRRATMPSSNVAFWREKFLRNVARDARDIAALRNLGWRVGVVWECEILPEPSPCLLRKISGFLRDPQILSLPTEDGKSQTGNVGPAGEAP